MLIELDDRSARDLERVSPAKGRGEFVRLAIRRALDVALDLRTRKAYGRQPLSRELCAGDLEGWDQDNALAHPARTLGMPRRRKSKTGHMTRLRKAAK
jgi:hypothetical protein